MLKSLNLLVLKFFLAYLGSSIRLSLSIFTQVYSGYDDHNAGRGLKALRCSNPVHGDVVSSN